MMSNDNNLNAVHSWFDRLPYYVLQPPSQVDYTPRAEHPQQWWVVCRFANADSYAFDTEKEAEAMCNLLNAGAGR